MSGRYLLLKKIFVLYLVLLAVILLAPLDSGTGSWGDSATINKGYRSAKPARILSETILSGSGLTIEIILKTDNISQQGPSRIITFSRDKYLRNFTIGQQKRDLNIRLRTEQTDFNGTRPNFTVRDVFSKGKRQHIIVTYDFITEKVYANGKLLLETKDLSGRFSNWDDSYYLGLKNEITGNRPWDGNLLHAAIYNRALTAGEVSSAFTDSSAQPRQFKGFIAGYMFDEENGRILSQSGEAANGLDLVMDNWISGEQKFFLGLGFIHGKLKFFSIVDKSDIIRNVILFIPMGLIGFVLGVVLMKRPYKAAFLVFSSGTLFSLFAEVVQYFYITRDSSVIDIFTNMSGTMFGIAAGHYFLKSYWSELLKRET